MAICIDSQAYRASHLAWFYVTGTWPMGIVDHKDGDHTNQAWLNLRDTDSQINAQNRRQASTANKSSGLLGVSQDSDSGRWRARIWVDGKNRSVGTFSTRDEAHQAYLKAKRSLHPGCTI
jgi:hypothetical protein